MDISGSGRNLIATIDSDVSSEVFVNIICKSVWLNLSNIGRRRRYLTSGAAKVFIPAYLVSKTDYATVYYMTFRTKTIEPY